MWNVDVQVFAGPAKRSLFHRACAGRVCSYVADQVFTVVQLVWLASDVVLHAPVGTASYGAGDGRAIVSAQLLESCCCFVTSE
jgi:hypothetical protein